MKTTIVAGMLLSSTLCGSFLNQQPIINSINELKSTWKAGHNHYFDGKTMDQIKKLMGTLETPEHLKLPLKDQPINLSIPDQFFSAVNWPKCQSIKQVRDQSTCGSCWAFGAVETLSDRICIASKQELQTRISAQDLLTCCGITCGMGCNGGFPSGAWRHFKNAGVVTGWLHDTKEWCSPYSFAPCDHHTTGRYQPCGAQQKTPECVKSCQGTYPTIYKNDLWHASSVYSVPSNVQKIQTEIMTYGPVEASFTVHEDFLTYKSGVYEYKNGSTLGGHSVKIVGWGVQNGTPYWLVANSWNQDWGDKGFFKIRRGKNQCGIQSQVVAGIPKLKSQTLASE